MVFVSFLPCMDFSFQFFFQSLDSRGCVVGMFLLLMSLQPTLIPNDFLLPFLQVWLNVTSSLKTLIVILHSICFYLACL